MIIVNEKGKNKQKTTRTQLERQSDTKTVMKVK